MAIFTIIDQSQSPLLALRVEFLVLAVFFRGFCGFVVVGDVYHFLNIFTVQHLNFVLDAGFSFRLDDR